MNIGEKLCDNTLLNGSSNGAGTLLKGRSNRDSILKLHRLRYHLAVEGCTDSQLSLAKSFLHEATDSDTERKENAELAIRWVLMASSEGNKEALALLESCYNMGIGVTERNRQQIETCLQTTPEEKLAQNIGYILFRLIAYDIEEAIPLEYFQHRVGLYLCDNCVSEDFQFVVPHKSFNKEQYVKVQDVVKSLQQCLHGEAPCILLSEKVMRANNQKGNNKSFYRFKSLYCDTSKHTQIMFDHLVLSLSEVPLSFSYMVILMIIILTAFLFIPSICFVQFEEEIITFLGPPFLYLSYFFMFVSSVKIIYCENGIKNFEIWKKIICKFDKNAANDIPNKRLSNLQALQLFIVFLLGVFVFGMQSDIVNNHSVLCNGFLFISLAFSKSSKFESHWSACLLFILSLVLALTRHTQIFNEINFLSELWYTLHLFVISHQLELVLSATTVLSVCAAIIYMYMLIQYRFLSCLRFLVSIIWLQMTVQFFYQAMLGNCYGIIFWMFAFFSHSKLGLNIIFLIFLIADQLECGLCLFYIVFSVALHYLCTMIAKHFFSLSRNYFLRLYSLSVLLVIALICGFGNSLPPNTFSTVEAKNISWTKYSVICHRQAWSETNIAQTQINCAKFQGHILSFEASVGSVTQIYTQSLPSLPSIFRNKVINFNPISVSLYEIKLHIKGTFRVEAELTVRCDDRCKEFVLNITEGDLLNVAGILYQGIGTPNPILTLQYADCLSCFESRNCKIKRVNFIKDFKIRLSKAISFFLYPWINNEN